MQGMNQSGEPFHCQHCKRLKVRRTASQRYCGSVRCQRTRKNGWRRTRYASDVDYRDNQRDSTDTWLKTQGGAAAYHRRYRQRRKATAQTAGEQPPGATASQHEEMATVLPQTDPVPCANSDATLAKTETISDACSETPVASDKCRALSGTYLLIPAGPGRANSDVTLAKIIIISAGCDSFANITLMDRGPSPVYSQSP